MTTRLLLCVLVLVFGACGSDAEPSTSSTPAASALERGASTTVSAEFECGGTDALWVRVRVDSEVEGRFTAALVVDERIVAVSPAQAVIARETSTFHFATELDTDVYGRTGAVEIRSDGGELLAHTELPFELPPGVTCG